MKYIFFVFIFITFFSCSSSRKLAGTMPDRSKVDIYNALINRNIDFTWFSCKMSTALESPDENVSGSMTVKMKKDSIMWIAVKKFGIEAARILIDKENYTVLYRLEGAYETGPIDQLNQLFSLAASFDDAQQLLFGNVILPDSSQMKITRDSVYYVVDTKVDGLTLKYFVNGYNLELEKMNIIDQNRRQATASFSDYRKSDGFGKIAYERMLTFPYDSERTASLHLKFSEFEINVPKEIKFSIPDSYEKIN